MQVLFMLQYVHEYAYNSCIRLGYQGELMVSVTISCYCSLLQPYDLPKCQGNKPEKNQ